MRTDLLTEKEMNENSKLNLPSMEYQTFTVNETILDRTHPAELKIDGKSYNCIAHYIHYQKCLTWGLSPDICDYVFHKYKANYPVKADNEYISFEDDFNSLYAVEIKSIPDQYRLKWRNLCPTVVTEAVVSMFEQDEKFKKALIDTKKSLLIEISPSLLWGIDTKTVSAEEISNPINWRGENLYCQILMAVRSKYSSTIFQKIKILMTKDFSIKERTK